MSETTTAAGTPVAPAPTPATPQAAPAQTGPSTEELAALRSELAHQQAELERGREELNFLTQTFTEILSSQRGAPQAEPAAPTADDFNSDPTGSAARVADAAAKRAVDGLAGRVAPLIDSIAERTWAMELGQVAQHDPKNYGRLRRQVEAYFKQYPQEKKRAGASWDVFYRLRGQYHEEIRQLDEAERKTTPVASPASAAPAPPAPEKPKRPELSQKEMNLIRGLGISEAAYLKQRYGWEEAPANG